MTDKIVVSDRQRKTFDRSQLIDLRTSILEKSMLQPIVVVKTSDDSYRLVAGERRLRAVKELHDLKQPFVHETLEVPRGSIPVIVLGDRDLATLLQIEYDENVIRVDLSWQEQCAALAAIEEARKAADPTFTRAKLGREVYQKIAATNPSPPSSITVENSVRRQLTVAAAIEQRPELAKAKNSNEVYQILLKEQHEALEAERAKRRLRKTKMIDRLWDLKHGDLRKLMVEMPDEEVDLVLVDPPYGIDIDKEKFATIAHSYSDDEKYAKDIGVFIIQESWRVTKHKANLFMFCHWSHFSFLQTAAAQFGWSVWADPIIWQKSTTEGSAPWGRLGLLHTYETILWATRGERGIAGPIPDIFNFQKVAARLRQHGAEKPIGLLQYIIDKSTLPGDLVLDPCCGSGSTILAAAQRHRRAVGFELDETYFNRAMTRMSEHERGKGAVA